MGNVQGKCNNLLGKFFMNGTQTDQFSETSEFEVSNKNRNIQDTERILCVLHSATSPEPYTEMNGSV